jgi:hypothetical protein
MVDQVHDFFLDAWHETAPPGFSAVRQALEAIGPMVERLIEKQHKKGYKAGQKAERDHFWDGY